jgi:hypothetical protein
MGDESQFERTGEPPVGQMPWLPSTWVPVRWPPEPPTSWYNSLPFHVALFFLTVLTTLVVGTHIALNYAHNV